MILDKIIKNKRKEIEIAKAKHPLDSFRPFLSLSQRNFRRAITAKRGLALIGEIKKASPSGLDVKDFTFGSGKKVWWKCKTGIEEFQLK